MMKTILCDIDGTIANTSHRIHHLEKTPKDWKSWHENSHKDEPIWEVVIILEWASKEDVKIVLCTAREEQFRNDTVQWLNEHNIKYDALYMRKTKDRRNDDIVKLELLDEILKEGYEILFVLEDRSKVTKMWRSAGLRCLQVSEGDF